jgi:hypothetical protein
MSWIKRPGRWWHRIKGFGLDLSKPEPEPKPEPKPRPPQTPARYTISPDGHSITCHTCGRTSHNLNDVRERFCGNCHVFHDERR